LLFQKEDVMKTMIKFVTIVAIGLGLIMPLNMALADRESFNTLSAKWWQWATSIPTSKNPLLDTTGSNCMVGNTALYGSWLASLEEVQPHAHVPYLQIK
jgi:hypothetical protein